MRSLGIVALLLALVVGAAAFGGMRAWSSSGAPPSPPQVARPVPPGPAVTLSAVPANVMAGGSIFLRQPDPAMARSARIAAATAIANSGADAPVQQTVLVDNQHYDERGVLQHQLAWAIEYPAKWTDLNGRPAALNEAVSFVDAVSGKWLLTVAY